VSDCCEAPYPGCSFSDPMLRSAMAQSWEAACRFGSKFRFYVREESGVSRDPYRNIRERIVDGMDLIIPALPVNYSPTRRQLDKVGIKESVDIIITTPSVIWFSEGVQYRDIDVVRWLVENTSGDAGLPSHAFRIKEHHPDTIIAGVPVYWVFGLVED
jgi:hypothetical protein